MNATELLARNLQALLELTGWTRTDLAKRARLPPKTVGEVLHGATVPSLDVLVRLAAALGVSVADLLNTTVTMLGANPDASVAGRSRVAREIGRLVDDFLTASPTGRRRILTLAADEARKAEAVPARR